MKPIRFYGVGGWRELAKAFRDGVVGLVLLGSVWVLLALLVQV